MGLIMMRYLLGCFRFEGLLLLLFCLSANVGAVGQSVLVKRPLVRRISEGFHLDSVRIAPKATTVYAACSNWAFRPMALVRTAPPGHNDALRLIADRVFYHLKAVEGLPADGSALTLGYGDTARIVLTFEPLPAGVKSFDLIEGAAQAAYAWMALGVQVEWSAPPWPWTTQTDFEAYWAANVLRSSEMEGYAVLEEQWTSRRGEAVWGMGRSDTVALVEAWNRLYVFRLDGTRLPLIIKHFKQDRYTLYYEPEEGAPLIVGTRSLGQLRRGTRIAVLKRSRRALKLTQEGRKRWYWCVKVEDFGQKESGL